MKKMTRALILAPHPDDGEFSTGGTICKMSREGTEFWYAAFSPCAKSIPEGFSKDVLFQELENAVSHLGIPAERIKTYQFSVRDFPEHRQPILEEMIKLRDEIDPDTVFMPNSNDVHQDHQVIHNEGVRAFKNCNMLGYEVPWNSFKFSNDYFVKLNADHLDAKWKAIQEYKSQEFRKYSDRALFDGLARVRGCQVNTEFAEAFELIRWIA